MSAPANPLVSVIMPAYRAGKHLARAAGSVLDQTYENIELIIVDDGSPDNTLEIANTLRSGRVKVVSQENRGGCAARNLGIEMSRGRYIQFQDADDLISTDKIEHQVKALLANPGKVAVCRTVHFFDGDDPFAQPVPDESSYLYDTDDPAGFFARLWGADGQMWMVQTSAWMIERTMVEKSGRWNPEILLDQDGEFFSRIVLDSKGICFTEGINYYRKYRKGINVAGKYHSYENLASAIHAARLKSGRLITARDDERTRKASANLFMQLAIDAYPAFPDLHREAMGVVRQMNARPVIPVLGGRSIEWLKHLFGWKFAKRVSHEFHKSRTFRKATE